MLLIRISPYDQLKKYTMLQWHACFLVNYNTRLFSKRTSKDKCTMTA